MYPEIKQLKGKPEVDTHLYDALHALRGLGNVGAHPEKDPDIVIDLNQEEAEQILRVLDVALKLWFVIPQQQANELKGLTELADEKKKGAKAQKP